MSASLEYLTPEPIHWPQQQVQKFAEEAATKLGYAPGGDIEAVVQRMHGKIEDNHWDSPSDTGCIEIRGPNDFTIQLSPLAGGSRRRFTIAHELGHYILHARLGKVAPMKITREGTGRLEWEANWFAAGFLMPETEFRRLMNEGLNDAELAYKFDVSMAAVQIRRTVLG